VFWIDPIHPGGVIINGTPAYVSIWGNVVTIPEGLNNLKSVSFYVAPSGTPGSVGDTPATYMQLTIYKWCSGAACAGPGPIDPPIYQSNPVAVSHVLARNNLKPDPLTGYPQTLFKPNVPVEPGAQYIFETTGDGEVGIVTADARQGAQLFSWSEDVTIDVVYGWNPFPGFAFRSDLELTPSARGR
jgi:hypothetical protein